MKKRLFIVMMVLLMGSYAFAQQTQIGFTAGSTFSNYHATFDGESQDGNTLTGITAGIFAAIPTGRKFSFEPAVNFVQKGTKDEQTFGNITEKIKLTVNCIEIPLNFLYNATGNSSTFFIGAGPSLSFSVSGKWKYNDGSNSSDEKVNFGNTDNDDMKGLDLGANFLSGLRFRNGLQVSVHYNAGLSNLAPSQSSDNSSTGKLTSHYFGLKLGWLMQAQKAKQ